MDAAPATQVLATDTLALFREAVCRAAELLRAGQLVALPTETVYGLAANALDALAVAEIFRAKDRPACNPIIVHVGSIEMARRCVVGWPDVAGRLAAAFWPGPLTMVLPRAASIPDIVTAGGSTVGVRWPSHPFIRAVISECGFPLAAPSANRSNQLSPTSAEHVLRSLGGRVRLIVDGGQSHVGIESTVVDLTRSPLQVLRPGMIHEESLAAAAGAAQGAAADAEEDRHHRSPGQLPKHYAPKARLRVCSWTGDDDLRRQIAGLHLNPGVCHVVAHTSIPSGKGLGGVSVIPHDAGAFARALYAELHRCDHNGAEVILVEAVPVHAEWRGIADRLRRAAS